MSIMSFTHPCQVKWSSLFLVLLTLLSELPSIATYDRCAERCDNNRLPGFTGAYNLNCDQVYHSTIERNICREDCNFCPDSICKSSNPSVFRCPPFVRYPERCKARCNANRPSWSTLEYEMLCSQAYSSNSEIAKCQAECTDCPREICISSISDKYHCPVRDGPSPPITGNCLARCNNNRPKGTTGAYKLSCIQEYATIKELTFCREACSSGTCPHSVCDPYNPDIYHCPAKEPPTTTTTPRPLYGICKERCDKHRPARTTEAYTFNCRTEHNYDDEIEECRDDCYSCYSICDYHRDKDTFKCPKIAHPLPPPTPPPPPTYEGKCESRCTSKRGQGPYGISSEPYILNCFQAYSSNKEQSYCTRDCKKCPKDVCDENNNNYLHHCRVHRLEKRCDDMCKANRKFGTKEKFTFKCSKNYSSEMEISYCQRVCIDCRDEICSENIDNDTYKCPKVVDRPQPTRPDYGGRDNDRYNSGGISSRGFGSFLIGGVILVLLILVACIGTCIYCCVRKKPMAQTGQQYAASGAQGYPMGGQQRQPYPMTYNYVASQSSASSISVPSSQWGSTATSK